MGIEIYLSEISKYQNFFLKYIEKWLQIEKICKILK